MCGCGTGCFQAALANDTVCLKRRFLLFDAVVTPVAFFAAAHKAMFHADICQFDAELTGSFTMMSFWRTFLQSCETVPAQSQVQATCLSCCGEPCWSETSTSTQQDGRRIEVIANGLPLWGRAASCRHPLGLFPSAAAGAPRRAAGRTAGPPCSEPARPRREHTLSLSGLPVLAS